MSMKILSLDVREEDGTREQSYPEVHFVVTGFGPFRDVPQNPTQVIIERLVSYLQRRESAAPSSSTPQPPDLTPRLSAVTITRIIETSAEGARNAVDALFEQLGSVDTFPLPYPTQTRTAPTVVMLHLGVNYKGTEFQIERCGYNEADFRVPDERGEQPQRESIVALNQDGHHRELGEALFTEFDVPALVTSLNISLTELARSLGSGCNDNERQRFGVRESTDPGRFVCNYTYCLSLDRCQKHNSRDDSRGTKTRSLFLHVPPFDQIPEPAQLEFIARLMEELWKQVLLSVAR
jgi:pyroglutamyl-peptidase